MAPLIIGKDTIPKRSSIRGQIGWTGFHKILDNHLIIHHSFNYNQSLHLLKDYRLRASIDVDAPIYKALSINIGTTINYENVVPLHTKKTDFIMYFGLSISNM